MKKTIIFMALAALPTIAFSQPTASATDDLTKFVDPKIGSGEHGHVFVGASVPFGMVQLGPTSIPQTWDWCSGYHDSDSTVIGFSHTHLSGTGIGDLFDITVMPVIGEVTYARGSEKDPKSGMWSYGDRSREIARPGYYSVPLSRYGILAEMTATPRTGLHRYTFPASDNAALVFDLENGGCWDRPVKTRIEADGNRRLKGYRFSKGWANDQKVYFVAEFSKPFSSFTLHGKDNMYGRASFSTKEGEQVLLKVGISPVSIEAAEKNLRAESPGFDFDGTASRAKNSWNEVLTSVSLADRDDNKRKILYTSLYHSMMLPALFSDYGTPDRYTILSLWDTYRAEMPLLSILQPERYSDIINTMLDIHDRQGRLPVWHLWGNETDCMVGNPGVIAVAEAVVKKTAGVDAKRALEAMVATQNDTIRGLGLRQKYGYIPSDLNEQSVAYDMEYAIADAAVANAAAAMGDRKTAGEFRERSHSYRNYFDRKTGFIRGRLSDGSWREPFDPFRANYSGNDYCEGNAWQYTWLVPHDIEGLKKCFGSRKAILSKLDSLFTAPSYLTGEDVSPDVSGLIGQYAHGNEPSHHVPYLYAMLGERDRASAMVKRILEEQYTAGPDGISGNEDAGQMSAWYVMSALGFYPVEPAGARYWFGYPLFDEVSLKVPGGSFRILVRRDSKDSTRIKRITLNGKPYTLPYITHSDIMRGGDLQFEF